jgi:hypothetical protein
VTDPRSRLMKDSRKVIQPCYNGQIAVDDKEQVVVTADVQPECHRLSRVQASGRAGGRNLGNLPREGSIDAGYSSYDN